MLVIRPLATGAVALVMLWGIGAGAVEPEEDAGPRASIPAAEPNRATLACFGVIVEPAAVD